MSGRLLMRDSKDSGARGPVRKKLMFIWPVVTLLLATLVFAGSLQWQSNRLGESLRESFQKNQQASAGVLAAATEQEFRRHVDNLIALTLSDEFRQGPPQTQKVLDDTYSVCPLPLITLPSSMRKAIP